MHALIAVSKQGVSATTAWQRLVFLLAMRQEEVGRQDSTLHFAVPVITLVMRVISA